MHKKYNSPEIQVALIESASMILSGSGSENNSMDVNTDKTSNIMW